MRRGISALLAGSLLFSSCSNYQRVHIADPDEVLEAFAVGDRVIVQLDDGDSVKGTVTWVEHPRFRVGRRELLAEHVVTVEVLGPSRHDATFTLLTAGAIVAGAVFLWSLSGIGALD